MYEGGTYSSAIHSALTSTTVRAEALTKVGLLGIKVWICRGEIYGKVDLTPNFTQEKSNGGRQGGKPKR